jgi:hypothetical protein
LPPALQTLDFRAAEPLGFHFFHFARFCALWFPYRAFRFPFALSVPCSGRAESPAGRLATGPPIPYSLLLDALPPLAQFIGTMSCFYPYELFIFYQRKRICDVT